MRRHSLGVCVCVVVVCSSSSQSPVSPPLAKRQCSAASTPFHATSGVATATTRHDAAANRSNLSEARRACRVIHRERNPNLSGTCANELVALSPDFADADFCPVRALVSPSFSLSFFPFPPHG